jgi:hypothetical protein
MVVVELVVVMTLSFPFIILPSVPPCCIDELKN